MKILVIGDVHGKPNWKRIVHDMYDKIVFIGDYMDSFEYSTKECLRNMMDIIYYARQHPDKVELLIGNHELHYFFVGTNLHEQVKCSGYVNGHAWEIRKVLEDNKDILKPIVKLGKYIFTHAGFSGGAWQEHFDHKFLMSQDLATDLVDFINELWKGKDRALFAIGHYRGGDHQFGSIFWADIRETSYDPLEGLHQVVGHTCIKDIKTEIKNENTSITYVDVYPLDRYLILEIDNETK